MTTRHQKRTRRRLAHRVYQLSDERSVDRICYRRVQRYLLRKRTRAATAVAKTYIPRF